MSTKLYDGLRIKNAKEEDVIAKLDSLKPLFKEVLRNTIAKKISSEYFNMVDNVFNNDNPQLPCDYAQNILKKEMENIKNDKRSIMFQYDFVIYVKQYKSDVYLYPFYRELNDLNILMEKIPELEDFGYWDNTDKPEEISESHWKKREKIWNTISNKYTFEESGFKKISLNDIKDFENISFNYELFVPKTKEKRLDIALKNIYISVIYKELIKGKKPEEITHSMYMEALDHYLDESTKNEDLLNEIKIHLATNINEVNESNFLNIKTRPFKKFKTEIKL
tara:strand:- start:48915 stop:49751 length:837 start_codon:yes stop_codon:yes gene_type:complete